MTNDEAKKALNELAKKVAQLELFKEPKQKTPKSDMADYAFWNTQPVLKPGERDFVQGTIETPIDIPNLAYPLPQAFEWVRMDLDDPKQVNQVYELLADHYVEDDDASFRFNYKPEFLQWALRPPGWNPNWLMGVRVISSQKLVAFISAIPTDLAIHDTVEKTVEINFLCVHKKLRSKRLAPLMIKEITRQVHLTGRFHAVYTAGVYLPTPVSTVRYHHRSLSTKKLVDIGFSFVPRGMTLASLIKANKLPAEPVLNMRLMTKSDVPFVQVLLEKYLQKFHLHPNFSNEEIEHWLLPIEGVIYSYVVEEEGLITDVVSFYSVPSQVMKSPEHKLLNAAYLFYYAPKSNGEDETRLSLLINDALIMANKNDFDVFNCVEVMQNKSFLEELGFGRGDGDLNYYLYNYKTHSIKGSNLGLVLL